MSRGGRFDEGKLRFTFDSAWHVVKYDDEPAYRNGAAKLTGTKAVDFLALHESGLFLLEVKDFRGYRIQNKKRIADGDLAMEIAHKVKDTVAALVGLWRWREEPPWDALARSLEPAQSIRVVVWLEEDSTGNTRDLRAAGRQSTLRAAVERHLRWLKVHVLVESPLTTKLHGVTVSNVTAAGH